MGRGNYKKKNITKGDNMEETVKEIQIESIPTPIFSVKVVHPSLRMRSTPEIAENVVGVITD